MRLLMTTRTSGEGWDLTLELARGLAEHGVQTTLAAMGRLPTPQQCRSATTVPGLELRAGRFPEAGADDAEGERAGEWLLSLAERARPDVIHLDGFRHAVLPFGRPVVAAGRTCVYSWWRAVVGEDPPGRYWRIRRAVCRGLHAASAVVAPSRSFLRGLEDVYAGPFSRGRVVPDGIPPVVAAPAGRKDPFILGSGRLWDPALNLSMLDAVADRVEWPIRVEGDATPPEGSWDVQTRHLDLMGRLPRAARAICMARAAIFCHPASYDPYGRQALEAGASGCALVLSDIPGHRERWSGAALLVPPDDPDAIAAALQRLVDRPEERAEWGERAARRAARFPLAATVQGYLGLYRELALSAVRPAATDRVVSAQGLSS